MHIEFIPGNHDIHKQGLSNEPASFDTKVECFKFKVKYSTTFKDQVLWTKLYHCDESIAWTIDSEYEDIYPTTHIVVPGDTVIIDSRKYFIITSSDMLQLINDLRVETALEKIDED